jgi:hypothetical protein
MGKTIEANNKALLLEAFNTAFNTRDDSAYERYWSPDSNIVHTLLPAMMACAA